MTNIRVLREAEERLYCQGQNYNGDIKIFLPQEMNLMGIIVNKTNSLYVRRIFGEETFDKISEFLNIIDKNPEICTRNSPSADKLRKLQAEIVDSMKDKPIKVKLKDFISFS